MDLIAIAHAAAEVAPAEGGIAGVAATLGLNGKLFLAQLLNFGLLVFVLRWLLYRPLVDFMRERSERIAQGLEKEHQATERLKAIDEERVVIIARADAEAKGILVIAHEQAAQMEAKAREKNELMATETRARLEREAEQVRQETLTQVREQAAELVVLAAEKVLREKIDAPRDRELVERALKEVSL